MPSFEKLGHSESFDPQFALFKSFIERQQDNLVTRADPEAYRSHDAVNEMAKTRFGGEGNLAALGCDEQIESN